MHVNCPFFLFEKSDNGPPFTSFEAQEYFAAKRIKHNKTSTVWLQANSQVEITMPSLNKALKLLPREERMET